MSDSATPPSNDAIRLLDEVDELMRGKLIDLERLGVSSAELEQQAAYFGNMFDLLDAKVNGDHCTNDSKEFKEATFSFIVDCFMERLQIVYENEDQIPPEQTRLIVERVRGKLRQLRRILFNKLDQTQLQYTTSGGVSKNEGKTRMTTALINITYLQQGVVQVILNQEQKLNAINNAMWKTLAEEFADISTDDTLRCVIITGAGEKAFSVGADISEFEQTRSTAAKAKTYADITNGALSAIATCRHPVIAQINGLCVGGGLELAAMCDIRICADNSRFGVPIKRLGLTVAYPEMQALQQLIGPANTLEMLLEGQLIDSAHALRIGLVNRIVPANQVATETLASARRIAEGAPLVARWHKKFARRLLDPTPLSKSEHDECYACFDTEDFQTGYQAFLAKRPPEFKGR